MLPVYLDLSQLPCGITMDNLVASQFYCHLLDLFMFPSSSLNFLLTDQKSSNHQS